MPFKINGFIIIPNGIFISFATAFEHGKTLVVTDAAASIDPWSGKAPVRAHGNNSPDVLCAQISSDLSGGLDTTGAANAPVGRAA
jgi:hypothetical protein